MVTSDFSWFKILSFFGVGLLVFLIFVMGGTAGLLISTGNAFRGVCVILADLVLIAAAYQIYANYQKKDRESKPGVKIEDIKNKK